MSWFLSFLVLFLLDPLELHFKTYMRHAGRNTRLTHISLALYLTHSGPDILTLPTSASQARLLSSLKEKIENNWQRISQKEKKRMVSLHQN